MPRAYDPAKILERWKRNFAGSREKYIDGVNAVDVAPTQRAKQAKGKAREAYNRAMEDGGAFDAGCDSVTLEDWRQRASTVGAGNLQAGAQKGSAKMEKFVAVGLPTTLRIADQIRKMPNATEADRDARADEYRKLMRQNKYSRRGRSR